MPYCAHCKKDVEVAKDVGSYWVCPGGAKTTTEKSRYCVACENDVHSYATSSQNIYDARPMWLCVNHDRPVLTYASRGTAKAKKVMMWIIGGVFILMALLAAVGFVASKMQG